VNRASLARLLFGDFASDRAVLAQIRPIAAKGPTSARLQEVPRPGHVLPLTDLPLDSPAVTFLQERDFDVQELAEVWGVGLCTTATEPILEGRIYIPVHMNGKLVGWQGRWPGEVDWKTTGISKYHNMKGMPKNAILYNFDLARQQPLVVICEGVTDVWRIGKPGVALLGKTASAQQLHLLATAWAGKPIVILLDADAAAEAEELSRKLRPHVKSQLVVARLPEGADPGSCPRKELWSFLRVEAQAQGVVVPDAVDPESVVTARNPEVACHDSVSTVPASTCGECLDV
jgi:hypothetical protein